VPTLYINNLIIPIYGLEGAKQRRSLGMKPSDLDHKGRQYVYIAHLYQFTINIHVNECGPRSTLGDTVAWLRANYVMIPLAKNIYLINKAPLHSTTQVRGHI